jgi:phosphate starvation-inducible PhoH-like protein
MSKKSGYSNGLLLSHIELTPKQDNFYKIMSSPNTRIVFLSGPAGTAKTFLSVYTALQLYSADSLLSILYLRSVIESADRSLGFLKGSMNDKFGPYMAPLEDKIDELLNEPEKIYLKQKQVLSAEPINFIRGQSWREKIVIVDEAQNMSVKELTTIITRIGRNSKIFLCGDIMQSDIRSTGFEKFSEIFNDEESQSMGIYNLAFDKTDIIRDPIITYIIEKMNF